MSRLRLLLAVPLLFVALLVPTQTARAQMWLPSGAWAVNDAPAPRPEPAWLPSDTPNLRFPVTVRLSIQFNRSDGFSYYGGGSGRIVGPTAENLDFRYRCDLTFPARGQTEFQARWVKPGRKLEILLQKPGTTHIRTCRLTTSVFLPPTPHPAPVTP